MKLIDEKEVEKAAKARFQYDFGEEIEITDARRYGFEFGSEFAEQKLMPIIIEFANYAMAKQREMLRHYDCDYTTQQLFDQFIKTKQDEI